MARRIQPHADLDRTPAHRTAPVTPLDAFSAAAPLMGAWCNSIARLVDLTHGAQAERTAALAKLAATMHDIAALAGEARNANDLEAVVARFHQSWMEVATTRQSDWARTMYAVQDEAARQFQSLADRQILSMTAGQVEPGAAESPVTTMMAQAREAVTQWTRDWTAIAHTPEVVQ